MKKTPEKPILFSAPMVRAILAGNKTQTRRAIRPEMYGRTLCNLAKCDFYEDYKGFSGLENDPNSWGWENMIEGDAYTLADMVNWGASPYGGPGGNLWVRETWAPSPDPENHAHAKAGYTYRADWDAHDDAEQRFHKWRPSIHMPRIASRITLPIVSLRAERLQEISEADAKAEGAQPGMYMENDVPGESYYEGFARLWASINGRQSWDANPWVRVVEFQPPEGKTNG